MTGSDDVVVLHSTRPPLRVARAHTYFAFASGRFTYDCVSCNAKCCRGFGYHVNRGPELEAQLTSRPAVMLFLERVDSGSGGYYRAGNCPPSCFFLNDVGRCGIHAAHGYDAKPETCRLFPFNNLRRVGEHLIVAPHVELCPLQILPGGMLSDHSRHDQLFSAMSAHGVGANVPEVIAGSDDVAGLLELEGGIVRESERHPESDGYARFAASQLSATSSFTGATERLDVTENVERFTRTMGDVLGMIPAAEHNQDPNLVRTMVVSTPLLRSHLIFRARDSEATNPSVSLARIPYLLMALHTLCALAREAGLPEITYQTVMRLFTTYRPLLTMLAYADCEMVWKPTTRIEWPFKGCKDAEAGYLAIVRSLLPGRSRARTNTLGRILCENVRGEGVERVLFLKQVAQRLADRILPASETAARERPRTLRLSLQHWALGHFKDELLIAVAARQFKPRA